MPYLHWETDRGRVRAAETIKEVCKEKMSTMSEVVDHQLANMHSHTNTGLTEHDPKKPGPPAPVSRRKALGQLFWSAATLLEAMEFHVEEQMIKKYLHASAPLHPRRTLDQSYYGALKSTGTRDRDQVVYRGTRPDLHDCVDFASCPQCNEDIRKVPRIVMVDQLWLWVLDESESQISEHPISAPALITSANASTDVDTVITSFPRRWGKNRPDPSSIHKSLRMRLKYARHGEISSAYDLALVIVDECSRVFFDRTKANDTQPNLVELFADAIRTVVCLFPSMLRVVPGLNNT